MLYGGAYLNAQCVYNKLYTPYDSAGGYAPEAAVPGAAAPGA